MDSQQDRRSDQNSRERIAVLETQMMAVLEQTKGMDEKLDSISSQLSEAKGGWKILMLLGGGAGAMGAAIAEWFHWAPK